MSDIAFTPDNLADAASRKVRHRQRGYPSWVQARRMTRPLTDRQTALMQAIATKFQAEADAEGSRIDLSGPDRLR